MKIGEYFKAVRLKKNMTEEEIARRIGPEFQASLLWDFESGDDNDIDGITIIDFKNYCHILGISPADYADAPMINKYNLSIPELVMERRLEKGLTTDDLAEKIGYEPVVVKSLEENKLEFVCIDALRQVSTVLDIPFRILLEKL